MTPRTLTGIAIVLAIPGLLALRDPERPDAWASDPFFMFFVVVPPILLTVAAAWHLGRRKTARLRRDGR